MLPGSPAPRPKETVGKLTPHGTRAVWAGFKGRLGATCPRRCPPDKMGSALLTAPSIMTYTTGHAIPQSSPPRPPRETLPTMYDLPSEWPEEPGLPDVGATTYFMIYNPNC
jgi:hypothetical protein